MISPKKAVFSVIPAHNEERYIEEVVRKAKKYSKVVVVDDASSDNTSKIAKKAGAKVLKRQFNGGLGEALKTGFNYALANNAKLIISLDGDAQHDPSEIPFLIKKMQKESTEAVFGERDFNKIPLIKRIGNIFLSWLLRKTFKINMKDTQTGYRILSSEAYKKIKLKSSGYSIASEILIRLEKNQIKYTSMSIKTIYHEKHKGANIFSGIMIALTILKMRLFNKK